MTRVLVVEDTPALRTLLAEALSDAGFDVQSAEHGAEALQIAEDWRPDVILLDLMMPVMDGPTFLKSRQQLPWLRAVPVMVLTAQPSQERLLDGLGATVTLRKPYDLDRLMDAIHALAQGETGRSQAC